MEKISAPFGSVEIFETNNEFGASVLVIDPGKEIPAEFHKKMTEIEVIFEGEVEFNQKILKVGVPRIYKPGDVHGYKNIGTKSARILCITVPKWLPDDTYPAEEKWKQ